MALVTDTVSHSVPCATQTQFDTLVAQMNAYTQANRQPPILNRVDDAANLLVTYSMESGLDLGD